MKNKHERLQQEVLQHKEQVVALQGRIDLVTQVRNNQLYILLFLLYKVFEQLFFFFTCMSVQTP